MPIRDLETFLPDHRAAAALPRQPRRERHRRAGLVGARRGGGRAGAHVRADRRRRPLPRHERAARGEPPRRRGDDRRDEQRRRRDLRLPADRAAPRRLRGAVRHADRPRPREGRGPLRAALHARAGATRTCPARWRRPASSRSRSTARATSSCTASCSRACRRWSRSRRAARARRTGLVPRSRSAPGSTAISFTSVSASSASGWDSPTTPPPAKQCAVRPASRPQRSADAELAVLEGVHPAHRRRVPAAVHLLQLADERLGARPRLAADRRRRVQRARQLDALSGCASCARTGVARCWMLATFTSAGSSAGVTQTDSGCQRALDRVARRCGAPRGPWRCAGAARRGGRRPPGPRCGGSSRPARRC